MIELILQPEVPPMSGDAFKKMAGPFSIALDGFVNEGPWFDPTLPCKNFNHHEGVSRLDTRATCAQVLVSLRQGFFKRFRDSHGPQAHVYANDCDEDVCMAWFLLKNHALTQQALNPALNRLVHMVDMLDTTAGAFPFPEDMPSLRGLAWVMEPYRNFRARGGLNIRDAAHFRSIVTDVENRIHMHLAGTGREIDLDTRYEVLENHGRWQVVSEIGGQARVGMFANGVRAFVSVSPRADGRWSYVIGRMSDYIDFPVPSILEAMDAAEGLVGKANRWGGGGTIGGSPRIGGSSLPLQEVVSIVTRTLS